MEPGNPNVVWSASEDGTLRQHDLREGTSCPQAGSSHQECRNVLVSIYTILSHTKSDKKEYSLVMQFPCY